MRSNSSIACQDLILFLMSNPKVFISYSHDSDAHRERVLALSERLREDGIETLLDRYVNGSPQKAGRAGCSTNSMPQTPCSWLHRNLLPPIPRTRRSRQGQGRRLGGRLITQELYDTRSQT